MSTKICALFIAFASFSMLHAEIMEVHGDCSKFLNCAGPNNCYIQNCPPGLEFNPMTGNCESPFPNRAGCTNRVNQAPSATYKGPPKLVAFPGKCNLYYQCAEIIKGCYVRECGPGTHFHPEFQVCGNTFRDSIHCRD